MRVAMLGTGSLLHLSRDIADRVSRLYRHRAQHSAAERRAAFHAGIPRVREPEAPHQKDRESRTKEAAPGH